MRPARTSNRSLGPAAHARHRHRTAGAKIKLDHDKLAVRRGGAGDRGSLTGDWVGGRVAGLDAGCAGHADSQNQRRRTHNG
jgi:hypothetical protein